MVGVKSGDENSVIGYQVGYVTHTCSEEHFVAWSQISPGLLGKVLSLAHFPTLTSLWRLYLHRPSIKEFEHGPISILIYSVRILELDASFSEPNVIASSVSLGFVCLVCPLSDNSEQQLVPSIKYHKIWCQARVLPLPVSLGSKMLASELIHYFESYSAMLKIPVFFYAR